MSKIVRNAGQAIIRTNYFNALSIEQQKNFKQLIKRKKYQVMLFDDIFQELSWQEALSSYVAPNGLFDNIYNYFSLQTHPSIISMDQFNQAFEKEVPEYPRLCITATQYIISFMSMFLQEYISIFSVAKTIYEKQNEDVKNLLTIYDYRKNK